VKAPALISTSNYGIFVKDEPVWDLLDALQPDILEMQLALAPGLDRRQWKGDALKVFFAHGDQIGAYPQRWLDSVASADPGRERLRLVHAVHEPLPRPL
jgi:alpha-1,6-mannosyltransferase